MAVDFDSVITRTHAVLSRSRYVLNEVTEEGRLLQISEELKLVLNECPAGYEKRNVFLFLLLNADAEFIDDVAEDENVAHLIDTIPRMKMSLVLQLILSLDGLFFLKELIAFAPTIVSLPVVSFLCMLDAELEHNELKEVCLPREVAKACFHKLVLSRGESMVFIHRLLQIFKGLQTHDKHKCQCLPEEEGGERLISSDSHRKASLIVHNLEICLFCLQDIFSDHSRCWEGYLIRCDTKFQDSICGSSAQNTVKDVLCECRNMMISKCNEITRQISIDNWLDWAEKDFKPSETYQQYIGKLAYGVKSKLEDYAKEAENQTLTDLPSLIEALAPFAYKPITEDDKIKCATLKEIVEKFGEETQPHKGWSKALLASSNILDDNEAIEVVRKHCELLDVDDVGYLMDKIISKVNDENTSAVDKEMLKCLSYQIMKALSLENILQVFRNYVDKYGVSSDLCYSEFSALLRDAFNRILLNSSFDDQGCSEILRLSVLNATAVVQKALEVGLQSVHTLSVTSKLLHLLKPVSKSITMNWVSEISEKCIFHQTERENFPALVSELMRQNLLPKEEFLKLHVLSALNNVVEFEDWDIVYMWLETLGCVLFQFNACNTKIGSVAVLVLYLGQVLEHCQQSLVEFLNRCVQIREKTLELIDSLKILPICEPEQEWLQSYVSKYSIVTQCHLKPFWSKKSPPDQTFANDICFNSQVNTPEFAAYVLVEFIPFLTSREWRGLANVLTQRFAHHDDCGYSTFQSFHQAATLLISACAGLNFENGSQLACLNHSVCCLGDVLRFTVMPILKTSNCLHVLEETLYLLSKEPSPVWSKAGMHLLPDLLKIMGRVPPEVGALNTLSVIITTCPVNEGRILLEREMKAIFREAINEVSQSEMNNR